MKIVYKGQKNGYSRCAIISYSEREENNAFDLATEIDATTPYKADTCVYGLIFVEVDDINDFNKFKGYYKEIKKSLYHSASDSDSDTSDSDSVTIVLGSFDDVQTDIYICPQIFFNSENFLPVPRWFYQRSNIYVWSAVLSAFLAVWGLKDRRKRVVVKPVRVSPHHCYPVIHSPYGMPSDYYPFKVLVDGLRMWDCRSCYYNSYIDSLICPPPFFEDELPF